MQYCLFQECQLYYRYHAQQSVVLQDLFARLEKESSQIYSKFKAMDSLAFQLPTGAFFAE
jgi:hypothetical protein